MSLGMCARAQTDIENFALGSRVTNAAMEPERHKMPQPVSIEIPRALILLSSLNVFSTVKCVAVKIAQLKIIKDGPKYFDQK